VLCAQGETIVATTVHCLFTVGTSTCPVRRHHLYDEAIRPMNTSVSEAAHVLAGYDALDDVDLRGSPGPAGASVHGPE
jgi:hypothetical protein